MLHNGYEYDKQKCYNEKIYWQYSMKRDCKARAHTVDGEVIVTLNEHTHAPLSTSTGGEVGLRRHERES